MHLSYMHPVTSENQFHCTRLYDGSLRLPFKLLLFAIGRNETMTFLPIAQEQTQTHTCRHTDADTHTHTHTHTQLLLFSFFFCKDGSDRLMKRASFSCCNFLCVVLAAAYLKYRRCRLSCLPFVWHFFFIVTHTHIPTHACKQTKNTQTHTPRHRQKCI